MEHPIRTALVGFGLAGSVFHAPALASSRRFSLDVIVTSDPLRQAAARRSHPQARIVDRSEETYDDVELVIVATPPAGHARCARAALEAGCDVVVDKPFTVTAAEGEELIALAADTGRILSTYQNRRWDGEFRTVQKLLAEGVLGDAYRFESRLERWQPEITKAWKAAAGPSDGGGVLYDLGTHLIDQALVLFGAPLRVYGELAARRPEERADDDAFVALEHANGVISHLSMNLAAVQPGPRLRVLGSAGAYTKAEPDGQEAQLRAGMPPTDPAYGTDPPERWGVLRRADSLAPVPTERGNFGCFYDLLADAIREGGPVPVDPADSVAGLRIIEEVRRQSGR